jgi:hypothetical protein
LSDHGKTLFSNNQRHHEISSALKSFNCIFPPPRFRQNAEIIRAHSKAEHKLLSARFDAAISVPAQPAIASLCERRRNERAQKS